MIYKKIGKADAEISLISMGGHEYLPDHRSRGFNEDFEKAITPGYIFDGFGREGRMQILKTSLDLGINFFDVTHDSEKEALGRNLKTLKPSDPLYIQTRPEGFVYTYDENNRKMVDYNLLKAEAVRILKLLQRESIDFFNFAFMKSALNYDPEYLDKISENITRLKNDGLIQFACADTFSGEDTYLKQIKAGCFDVIYINFNFGDDGSKKNVFPAAVESRHGIIAREAFMKGELFKMAEDAGIKNKSGLAKAALKWILSFEEVTSIVYGTGNPKHLIDAVGVLDDQKLTEEEFILIDRIKDTVKFNEFRQKKNKSFFE